jgi:hypothetical protein
VSVNAANGDGQPNPVQMLAQRIGVGDSGLELNAFWDSGAQLTMIAHARAAECGLRRRRAPPLEVVAFDGGATLVDTGYHVPLVLVDGGVYNVFAYGVDEIATDLRHTLKDSSVLADFPEVTWEQVEGLSGQVELLIGMDNCRVFPAERSRKNSVALWASQFGTGWMLAGTTAASCACSECKCALPARAAAAAAMFRPPDFISAEAMGTETPARCATCRSCKECKFLAEAVSFKENKEYEVILKGLSLDVEKKKWTASYPFKVSPWTLIDNYSQARKCMEGQERRMIKSGRLEEFNKQFYETVERGVFRKLSPTELSEYSGPLNYISMVEAFKNGPHSTTPLRICMNSSMKQPQPSGKSLNDCLMKGPSALVDLFTVTLSMRLYRYALTKDLSKFYQRVNADELAQHVRRVIWRGGEQDREPDVYVTTTVNFGDLPAGCITIAALRETARRFGGGMKEAADFLMNRTYVDDATGERTRWRICSGSHGSWRR